MNQNFKGWLPSAYCLLTIMLFFAGCHTAPVESGQAGGWRALAVLPTSSPFFIVKLNSTLYAGTGANNGKGAIILTKLWQYDIATNTWRSKLEFPGKLEQGLSYFTVNEKAYCINKANQLMEYTPN